jgi:hypothetical protein
MAVSAIAFPQSGVICYPPPSPIPPGGTFFYRVSGVNIGVGRYSQAVTRGVRRESCVLGASALCD